MTEAVVWDGWSKMTLDGSGRLHVAAKGTYAWAIFPYADDILGPFDTTHERLYFGSTQIDFSQIIDNYEAGSTWNYYLPSLKVAGAGGTVTLVASQSDPGSILTLSFSQAKPGNAFAPNNGIGVSGGGPVCPAQ